MRAIRPSLRELRVLHRNLRAAIVADPYDATALHEALSALREQNEKVQLVSHESFIDFVTELTPAEREQLARDVGRGPPRKSSGHVSRSGHKINEAR